MAWGGGTGIGGANNKTAGTAVAMNPTAAVAVGAILVVQCVSDNSGTASALTTNHAVTDNVGNVYTRLKEQTFSAGVAADGVTTSAWVTRVTAALATTDTITLTCPAGVAAKAIGAATWTVAAGKTWSKVADTSATGAASATGPSVSLSGLANAQHLFIAVDGVERPTTDVWTQDADYGAAKANRGTSGGVADTNVWGHQSGLIATQTTAPAYTPTIGTAGDWASVLIALDEVSLPVAPPSDDRDRRQRRNALLRR